MTPAIDFKYLCQATCGEHYQRDPNVSSLTPSQASAKHLKIESTSKRLEVESTQEELWPSC